MAFSEVYQALQTGVVDGQENTWSNIIRRSSTRCKNTSRRSNHGVVDYMVLVNAKWWNGLPKDVRDGLTKAMEAATKTNNETANQLNEDAKKKIQASGVTTVHQLTPAQRAEWQKAMTPVWAKFESQIGKDLIAEAQKSNAPKTN